MISKKDLQDLIKTIRKRTGKTQQEVSVGAGYKEKTLTQLLSKNEDLEPAYDQLKIAYSSVLNNSTFQSKSIDFFIGKLETKEEVIQTKDQVIAQIEARRRDAEILAAKMEAHYKDMKEALERAQNTINEVLKPILEKTDKIEANSITIIDRLAQVRQMTRADDLEIMEGTDKILGRESGTTAIRAGIVEHALGAKDEDIDKNDSRSTTDSSGKAKKR
jgi:transcriptional regulator with XRE-family HTH domain